MNIQIALNKEIRLAEITHLYQANGWSAAQKPELLYKALCNSDTLVTARLDKKLIGIANAISDGYLVAYIPHMLILPEFQKMGVGKLLGEKLLQKYKDFHMIMLTSDKETISFYEKLGFVRAGETVPMWIYGGNEH